MEKLPERIANDNGYTQSDIESELTKMASLLRRAVDQVACREGFGGREAAALQLGNEVVRRFLQEQLEVILSEQCCVPEPGITLTAHLRGQP